MYGLIFENFSGYIKVKRLHSLNNAMETIIKWLSMYNIM